MPDEAASRNEGRKSRTVGDSHQENEAQLRSGAKPEREPDRQTDRPTARELVISNTRHVIPAQVFILSKLWTEHEVNLRHSCWQRV